MIWPLGRRRVVAIDASAWRDLQDAMPYLRGLCDAEQAAMRETIAAFLSAKTISGAQGVEPDDRMRLTIAAQACLPVLHLGLRAYDDFVEIVVHPTAFEVRRRISDDDGLVHEFDDVLSGEAMDGGPVTLSWEDVDPGTSGGRGNVVIHEFVHKLDMADGEADGCPPMPAGRRDAWRAVLSDAYDAFVDQVEQVEAAIPPDVDPEDEAADAWYARLPLDPYAATDEAEFFAVAAESFFVSPRTLRDAFPVLYAAFVAYFAQDPAARS